jgi:uncharacterized protein
VTVRLLRWAALLGLCLAAWGAGVLGRPAWAQAAAAELAVPALSARVIDQTGTLSNDQRNALEAKLAAFEARSGPQIVVLLVPGTQPEDIAAYAQRVADQWKIGRRDVGDGVLLLVAKNERRVRIEVAKALEGAIPDLAARQIIDQQIRPAFRADDYAGGLNRAVDALIARIGGEALPAPRSDGGGGGGALGSGLQLEELGLFFFIAVPLFGAMLTGIFGRRLGSLLTSGASGTLAWWFTSSLALAVAAGVGALLVVGLFGIGSAARRGSRGGGPWIGTGGLGGGLGGGSWGGGGSDGGGFSSGGGGDFGGGGASGDW